MDDIESVIKDLNDECHDDFVGLWKIVGDVRSSLHPDDLVDSTLIVIKRLLEQGMIAGQFYDHEFRQWQMPNDQIVDKIKKEWAELGHDPTGGDVVWLTSKEDS